MRKLILFLALFVIAAAAHAGMWGSRGVSRRFLASGDRLYVADGRGVSLYDVANPANIRRVDVEIVDFETRDLAFAGNDMLVVASRGGVDRFAIAADGTLSRIASIPVGDGGAMHIAADAQHMAIATSKGIAIYDRAGERIREIPVVRTVNALQYAGGYLYAAVDGEATYVYAGDGDGPIAFVSVDARDLALQGTMLWAAAGPAGLFGIDVSDPAAPRIATRAGAGEVNMTGIAVAGTRAFAAQLPDTVFVFDISSSTPAIVNTLHDPAAQVIGASGNRLFTAGTLADPWGSITETGVAVRAYDAATLSALGELKDTLSGPVSGAATDGTVAYIVDRPFFRILDVSNSDEPRELASIEIPSLGDRVRVRDGRAIVYGRGDVNLIDVSDIYAPKLLGTYRSTGHPPSSASFARDTFVEANFHSGLHVVDYSDPANPVQIAGRIWHYNDLVTTDDAIYAFTFGEFLVADLTDRRKVKDISIGSVNFRQAETAPAQAAAPEWLVLRLTSGFSILSLADRFAPREVASIYEPTAGIFGTSETRAYYEKEGHLFAMELPDGATSDTSLLVTSPQQIAAAGEKIVVADRYSVRVYGPNTAAPPPPPPPPAQPMRRRATRH